MKRCLIAVALVFFLGTGCKKGFLDVIPDNIPTMDNAFENRHEAEKYLATCYSYLPSADPVSNIMYFGADDIWTYRFNNYSYQSPWKIALGEQGVVSPFDNYWDGENHGRATFQAIRDCNTFLEALETRDITDLDADMRNRWIGEAQFLKAYYMFYLLRMYGPIPIIEKNLPISASPSEVKVIRAPFDECVNYVSDLLDQAIEKLPVSIQSASTEDGRATKAAALFVKAKLWVTAASPLFNGNPDYANFTDKSGVELFSANYDASKWEKAAEVAKEAIDMAHQANHALYRFDDLQLNSKLSDTTIYQMNVRGSVSSKENPERILGLTKSEGSLQQYAMVPHIDPRRTGDTYSNSYMSVTLKMTEVFYSNHGVPINEDKTYDYANRYNLRTATAADQFNIQNGYKTVGLNFDRENRYYADLAFDGGVWYMRNSPSGTDQNTFYIEAKKGQRNWRLSSELYNVTGYWPKNLVNWRFEQNEYSGVANSGRTIQVYSFPLFKLGDLYLLYAEALNEIDNREEAIVWLDKIRERAGLDGVKESWTNYSNQPNKFGSKDGLRSIIHQERQIELAFQGQRIWDLRRWKEAADVMNQPVQGWDYTQQDAENYYRPVTLFSQTFIAPRDYLWPIKEYNLTVNDKLVQNPGWK